MSDHQHKMNLHYAANNLKRAAGLLDEAFSKKKISQSLWLDVKHDILAAQRYITEMQKDFPTPVRNN